MLAERALLTEMGVLSDPVARKMVAPPWAAFMWFMRHWPFPTKPGSVTRAGLAARVSWYDAQVQRAIETGVQQIAVIGAGYDSRAWRFASSGVQFYELDLGITQRDKRRRAPAGGPTFVEADLWTQSAAPALRDGGLDRSRAALFILEGLTMYLTEDVVRRQLGDLAESSASKSLIAVDFSPPPEVGTAQDRRRMRYQRFARAGSGEEFKLLVDRRRATAIVEASGWVVTEATSLREAAREFVGRESGLPVDAVNEHKSLVAGVRSDM